MSKKLRSLTLALGLSAATIVGAPAASAGAVDDILTTDPVGMSNIAIGGSTGSSDFISSQIAQNPTPQGVINGVGGTILIFLVTTVWSILNVAKFLGSI